MSHISVSWLCGLSCHEMLAEATHVAALSWEPSQGWTAKVFVFFSIWPSIWPLIIQEPSPSEGILHALSTGFQESKYGS